MKQSHKLQSYQHDDITTNSSSTSTSTLSIVGSNCVNNSSNNRKQQWTQQQWTKLITYIFIFLLAMIIVGIIAINYNDSSDFQQKQQQDTISINTKFMDVSILEENYIGTVTIPIPPDKLHSHRKDNDDDNNNEEIIMIESQHNYDNDNDSTIDRIKKIRQQLYNLQQYINGTIYFPYMEHYNTIMNARWVKQYIPTKSLLNHNYNYNNTLGIIIIQVQDENDVQITVPILSYLYNTYDIPFRIRSGGHHKSGYSSLVDEIMKHDDHNDSSSSASSSSSSFDGIILCLSRLNHITMVPSLSSSSTDEYQSIIIGPAVRVLDILQQVTRPYMYGGVIGYCNQVAEGGFILGGGFGMQSRMYGLGLDNVISFNIVLANGTMITTKSTTTTDLRMSISDHESSINHNSDLFWALRGAGSGSYGVVTQMEYRIHPVSDTLHYVGLHLNDPSDISYFLYNMGRMSSNIPDNVALMFDESNTMNMIWTGRDENDVYNGDAYLHDLVTSIMEPKVQELDIKQGTISWLGTFGPTMDQPTTNNSSSDDDDKKSFNWGNSVWAAACWTGFLLPENNTIEVWDDIIHYLDIGLSYSTPYLAPDIEFWGGAIGRHPSDATAFPYRSAIYNVGVLLTIAENEPNASALFARESNKVNEWWHKVDRYLTGSYVNYPTVSLLNHDDPKHYAHVLWGENLPRLVKIKQQYDPDNVFQFPMSVPNEL